MIGERMAGALDLPDWLRVWLGGMTALDFLIIVAGAIVAVAAVVLFVRRVLPALRRLSHFLDDWFGEEARPGQPRRPGVMERLESVESGQIDLQAGQNDLQGAVDAQGRTLAQVHHEVFPNSGASFRDQADKTRRVVRALAQQQGMNPDELEITQNPKENR